MVKDGSGYARIERGEFPYFTLVIAIRSRIFSFVDRYIESFANWLRTIRSGGEREEAAVRSHRA